MHSFINSILYSYAQIFFSNRRWFGAVILFATFFEPQIGLVALCGVILSNSIAYYLKFDPQKIESGFYGFNGILFGAAVSFFFKMDFTLAVIAVIFIFITFFITTVIEHYFATAFNLPGLSLPFIISFFIFIVFVTNYSFTSHNYSFALFEETKYSAHFLVKAYFQSLSLIVLQPNFLAGALIAIALLFFSRVLFVLSIFSFIVNILFLELLLPQISANILLITGLNSILTSFAVGGSLILPSRKSFFFVLFSVMIIVILTGFFYRLFYFAALPIFVLPFNFFVLLAIYSLKFRKDQTDLTLLYFAPGSPEENLYYHLTNKARFENYKYYFAELPFFGEWFVSQGFDGAFTHKGEWKYAWDFVVVDENLSEFSNEGESLKDYYCYKLTVTAPLDGEVVKVVNDVENNKLGQINIAKNWGNTVIIKHDFDFYSLLSHLEIDSIKVVEGQKVKKGDAIALCGNSGRSPSPHIHFQFQPTDKPGDKTIRYPIANYLEKVENNWQLRGFDFPKEATIIKNLETNKTLKKAFDFQLGEKYKLEITHNSKTEIEEWEVKITNDNIYYIESSTDDKATFFIANKILYFTNYSGNKKSALYYFYLLAIQIPFCSEETIFWKDHYSIAKLPIKFIRYFSEFFLMLNHFISATGKFSIHTKENSSIIVANKIEIKGSSLFSFIKKNFAGHISVDNEGNLTGFDFSQENKKLAYVKFIN